MLTDDYKDTIKKRIKESKDFRMELIKESFELIDNGEYETGKIILKDIIEFYEGEELKWLK